MLDYNKLKAEETITTQNFSQKKFNHYVLQHKIMLRCCSPYFMWVLTMAIFLAYPFILYNSASMYAFFIFCHFIFWKFWGEKAHKKDFSDLVLEVEMVLEILEELKKEKFPNSK